MSNCGFTSLIDINSYLGDSLLTINNNMSSLDINSSDLYTLLTFLTGEVLKSNNTILSTDNIITSMVLSAIIGTKFCLITSTGTLLTSISADFVNNTNYQIETFTIPNSIYNDTTKIATSASLLIFSTTISSTPSGYNNSILFTIEGIGGVTKFILPKNQTYNYSWYFKNNIGITEISNIYLIGYI